MKVALSIQNGTVSGIRHVYDVIEERPAGFRIEHPAGEVWIAREFAEVIDAKGYSFRGVYRDENHIGIDGALIGIEVYINGRPFSCYRRAEFKSQIAFELFFRTIGGRQ